MILTSRQVSPMTVIGVWADCAISKRLYSNVWFLWCANRSNSSRIKRTGQLLVRSPEYKNLLEPVSTQLPPKLNKRKALFHKTNLI